MKSLPRVACDATNAISTLVKSLILEFAGSMSGLLKLTQDGLDVLGDQTYYATEKESVMVLQLNLLTVYACQQIGRWNLLAI